MQCRLLALHREQSGVSFGVMAVSHSLGSSVACRTSECHSPQSQVALAWLLIS